MSESKISRRKFLGTASAAVAGSAALGPYPVDITNIAGGRKKEAVSIVRMKNGNIAKAVEEAIDLLGGIRSLTPGKDRIMLKPNLVADSLKCTTKVKVVQTLAELMQKAGKEVMIGEGSAAAMEFNVIDDDVCRTKKKDILDGMQQHVFDVLGYSEMAKRLNIPLINLHSGDIVEVPLKNGMVAPSVKIHRSLVDTDLVCSVPMMKTHVLATVTLAMKNLLGLYPGTEYYSVRSWLHEQAAKAGSTGVAWEVMDICSAVKTGLSVIDASSAMEGDGPSSGDLVDLNLIIAGTSPLATDMVGASLMGFEFHEIPFIMLAHKTGMLPTALDDIEIRGLSIDQCRHHFVRPHVYKWSDISGSWGVKEI